MHDRHADWWVITEGLQVKCCQMHCLQDRSELNCQCTDLHSVAAANRLAGLAEDKFEALQPMPLSG